RIEGGGRGGQARRERRDPAPDRRVERPQEEGEPERARQPGREAQRARVVDPRRARRLPRQDVGDHDRRLGVEALLARALADARLEEALAPLQVEGLVVGPAFLPGRPEGVADGEGRHQERHPSRPPPAQQAQGALVRGLEAAMAADSTRRAIMSIGPPRPERAPDGASKEPCPCLLPVPSCGRWSPWPPPSSCSPSPAWRARSTSGRTRSSTRTSSSG